MNQRRAGVAARLACAALLLAGAANADPRGAVTMGGEPVPDTPLDVFLGRLPDKYKFEGSVAGGPGTEWVSGTADCVVIGAGPGVQCIFNVTWQEIWDIRMPGEGLDSGPVGVFEVPGGIPYLDPAMALFGLEPGKNAISHLLVNNKGMPEGGPGAVKGNRLTFRTECVNAATLLAAMVPEPVNNRLPDSCKRIVHMEAKPDSKVMWWNIDIEINDEPYTRFVLTLRRQPREEQDGKSAKP
jgi:hypothetical protein